MFHVKDGLFFERKVVTSESGVLEGHVHIVKTDDGKDPELRNTVLDVMLTPSEWASVVASVSALGENGATHALFLAAQRGH